MLDLRKLSESLQELGSAASQKEVSTMAGRKPSWLSATLAHQRRPSTGSLVALLFNLNEIVKETIKAAEDAVDEEENEAYKAGAADLRAWVQLIEEELKRRIENHEA